MLVPTGDAGSAPISHSVEAANVAGACLFGAQILPGCSFVMSAVVPLSLWDR